MDVAELFFEIDDSSQKGKCFLQLTNISMIMLCSYSADCEALEEVSEYTCDKQQVLRELGELPCGIPCHDTLNRAFRRLKPTQLETWLTHWGNEIGELLAQNNRTGGPA